MMLPTKKEHPYVLQFGTKGNLKISLNKEQLAEHLFFSLRTVLSLLQSLNCTKAVNIPFNLAS